MRAATLALEQNAPSAKLVAQGGSGDRPRRRVAIFADPLLAPTLTFVPAQGEALDRFEACYAGPQLGRGDGLSLPSDRTVVISKNGNFLSRMREARFRMTGYSPRFFRRIKEFGPELIHAHFGPGATECMRLARWLGVPIIANFHGGDALMHAEHLMRSRHYMHRQFWKRREELSSETALFLACSRFVRAEMIRKGFPEKKIRVHYIGIDTRTFSADATVQREPLVLYVGSLVERKGIRYLIEAMERVQCHVPDAEIIVIGDGPLRAEAERLSAARLRRYRFLGYRPPEIVRAWMNRARVFCVPSLMAADGNSEGFGLVFAEAQAMQLPVASFASGGIPEAVADGMSGLLCRPGDTEQLSRNLATLLTNDELWKRMSRTARAHVRENFDLKTCTGKLEEIYDEVLESRMPGGKVFEERGEVLRA